MVQSVAPFLKLLKPIFLESLFNVLTDNQENITIFREFLFQFVIFLMNPNKTIQMQNISRMETMVFVR